MFSPELKKGSMELLVLSTLDSEPRHGYEIGKLIEMRSGGRLEFKVSLCIRFSTGWRIGAG